MANDLDDLLLSEDCPQCGTTVRFTYAQMRLHKAAGCACGLLLRLEDDTPIAAVQALIDEADPPRADNDG